MHSLNGFLSKLRFFANRVHNNLIFSFWYKQSKLSFFALLNKYQIQLRKLHQFIKTAPKIPALFVLVFMSFPFG